MSGITIDDGEVGLVEVRVESPTAVFLVESDGKRVTGTIAPYGKWCLGYTLDQLRRKGYQLEVIGAARTKPASHRGQLTRPPQTGQG